ncbi:hypothetical protein [Chryseobacterium sp.]|uniref:hypothetical protein n=1 Tax=Chryseobacterium sp. TaxID=1871047 RepID=UPI00388FC26E
MKRKLIKIDFLLLLFLFFFTNCNSQKVADKDQQEFNGKVDLAFKEYLIAKKIKFKKLNDSIYSAYFLEYLQDESKQELEKNPYLKINKVYVRFRTPTSVEFSIYSDRGTFCIDFLPVL